RLLQYLLPDAGEHLSPAAGPRPSARPRDGDLLLVLEPAAAGRSPGGHARGGGGRTLRGPGGWRHGGGERARAVRLAPSPGPRLTADPQGGRGRGPGWSSLRPGRGGPGPRRWRPR